jgi:hypothetical protein
MTIRMQSAGSVVCQHCQINLEKIADKFEPPGTFYHPMNSWYADMRPTVVPSATSCPNAGKKFRFNNKGEIY